MFNPRVGKIPWKTAWQSAPVFLPGESHGQRSPVGYSQQGRKDSDMAEQLRAHTRRHICLGQGHSVILVLEIAFLLCFAQ